MTDAIPEFGDTGTNEGAGGTTEASPLDETAEEGPALSGGRSEVTDGCGEVSASLQQLNPTILLLLDQSLSMAEDFDGQQRWDAVYETLFDGRDSVVPELESSVRFGMTLFSTNLGNPNADCPALTSVDPEFDNADRLDDVYDDADPLGDTPTGESIRAATEILADLDVDGPKAILLATDGEPGTCAVPTMGQANDTGRRAALAAAEAAFEAGFQTFIVSVGDDIGEEHLQEMANVGAGKDADDNDEAEFYRALDADELVDAFTEIISTVTSCEFEIDGLVDLARACDGTVALDGNALECGQDWELVDPSTMALLGDACDGIRDGREHDLDARWPCGVIVPIP